MVFREALFFVTPTRDRTQASLTSRKSAWLPPSLPI
jgi:hypothetical protein